MSYDILILRRAQDYIKGLAAGEQKRIYEVIETLHDTPRPRGSIKLHGTDAYRLRVGDFRIIYVIREQKLLVVVIVVGNRRDIYQILQRIDLDTIP